MAGAVEAPGLLTDSAVLSLIILLAFTHEPSRGSLLPVEVVHFSPNSETQRMTNPSISFMQLASDKFRESLGTGELEIRKRSRSREIDEAWNVPDTMS